LSPEDFSNARARALSSQVEQDMSTTGPEPTATSVFKTAAKPYDYRDEQQARLATLYRMRAERREREAAASPPRKRRKRT
jgi:hypothetical protein